MKTKLRYVCILLALFSGIHQAAAQGTTAFTYQGQLRDGGTNANGTYTMTFKLYDAVSGGGQIGSTVSNSPTLANGLFTVNLDFGASAFNGSARWLDITVAGDTLTPRVQVLLTPYAQFAAVAATVTNGAIMNAQLAASAVATANIQNNAVTTTQIANGAVTNRNLTANAVSATNIASGQVVKNLNGLKDNIVLSAGANTALFTNGNNLQISAVVPNIQLFTSSGTFVVPTNVTRIMIEMWGGGGGGGKPYYYHYTDGTNETLYQNAGGGGGAGGYAWNVFNVTPGSNYVVTVGAGGCGNCVFHQGGTSSFGNLISAGGGAAGGDAGVSFSGAGGVGGDTAGSLAPVSGSSGDAGVGWTGGKGGSVWRGGSPGKDGDDADGPGGGGGGGGLGGNAGDIVHVGGDGGLGVVIVTY